MKTTQRGKRRETRISSKQEKERKRRAKEHRSKNRRKSESAKKRKRHKEGVKWQRKERRKRSPSSSDASSSEESVAPRNRREKETGHRRGAKRHRKDTVESEVERATVSKQESSRHISKKKQRIEIQPSSSSERASIPQETPVATEEPAQSSEDAYQEVPVVAKRRAGRKGMRAMDLFEEEVVKQREEDLEVLANQRQDTMPPRKLAPSNTSGKLNQPIDNKTLLSTFT